MFPELAFKIFESAFNSIKIELPEHLDLNFNMFPKWVSLTE